MERMVRYNGTDVCQINHALNVTSYALLIAKMEGCDARTVERITIAAILHDIGMHEAAAKHGSTSGKYQELEGPAVAMQLMSDLAIAEADKERISFIIGHHHTLRAIDGIDFQILVEADYLVNAFEQDLSGHAMTSMREKVFRTVSGRGLFDSMYADKLGN
jgi:uncharacterized protein